MLKAPPNVSDQGWRNHAWRNCADITAAGLFENTPRYLRCMRCYRLVTHGEVSMGGCICGNRRLNSATELTWVEIVLLKVGWFPLTIWETNAIRPLIPRLAYSLRLALFRPTQRRAATGGGAER